MLLVSMLERRLENLSKTRSASNSKKLLTFACQIFVKSQPQVCKSFNASQKALKTFGLFATGCLAFRGIVLHAESTTNLHATANEEKSLSFMEGSGAICAKFPVVWVIQFL